MITRARRPASLPRLDLHIGVSGSDTWSMAYHPFAYHILRLKVQPIAHTAVRGCVCLYYLQDASQPAGCHSQQGVTVSRVSQSAGCHSQQGDRETPTHSTLTAAERVSHKSVSHSPSWMGLNEPDRYSRRGLGASTTTRLPTNSTHCTLPANSSDSGSGAMVLLYSITSYTASASPLEPAPSLHPTSCVCALLAPFECCCAALGRNSDPAGSRGVARDGLLVRGAVGSPNRDS